MLTVDNICFLQTADEKHLVFGELQKK